jgi:hypothetical protein
MSETRQDIRQMTNFASIVTQMRIFHNLNSSPGMSKSEVPVLFLSGSLDGCTPPSNAEEVRAGFSHSQHLIVENGAHGDEKLEAPGVPETMIDFLKGNPVSLTEAKLPFTFIPVAER